MEERMIGKVVLVTGATDGIGKATALGLASMGATLLIHGRNGLKGRQAVAEIRDKTGNPNIKFYLADFVSLNQVRDLAARVQQDYERLDVLVNNAGIFMPVRQLTEDGFETTFQVNVLAPFLLTNLLLQRLIDSSPARVVVVSSGAHQSADLDWDNLQGEKRYDGYSAYAQSKLCDILFTYALADRLQGTGVTANCLNPGVVNTNMLRAGWGSSGGASPEEGALTVIYLAISPEVSSANGEYYRKQHPTRSAPITYQPETQNRLWKVCEGLVGLA